MVIKLAGIAILAVVLAGQSFAATLFVGSDGAGPVQMFASDGTLLGNFGDSNGTAAAADGDGGLFIAIPGSTSSTVEDFDGLGNLLGSFLFTAAGDMRSNAAYIADLTSGDGGTLWVSTFTGKIYHLDSTGAVLSSFDTGVTAPGVTFDGTFLYTTSGLGLSMAAPFVYQRDTSGNITNTINTGLNDTLGIGLDSSTGNFWVGGIDLLAEVDPTGSLLNALSIAGTHYGVEAATLSSPTPPPTGVPEPSAWILMISGVTALFLFKARHDMRTFRLGRVLAACTGLMPLMYGAVSISSLTPAPDGPQPVGASITFTASASDTDPGPLRYRFRVRPSGAPTFTLLRDYSPANSVVWTPVEAEGVYEMEVAVLNRTTNNTQTLSSMYAITPRVTGSSPVVSATDHPLVALYSAPACPAGTNMRVRFKLPSDVIWQSNQPKACNGSTTMNFYVAGLRASSQYQLRHDVINGPRIVSGPTLTFSTGPVGASLPAVGALIPLKPPSSLTEGVVLFSPIQSSGPPFAVDASLHVIWYSPFAPNFFTRPVPGGDYLVTYGNSMDLSSNGMRELDIAGNLVKETNVERMNDELAAIGMQPVTIFHHEVRRLDNGNYMLLAAGDRISDAQGPNTDIVGDTILVLDSNLQLLWAWDSFAHLDVTRKAVLNETCPSGTSNCVLLNASTANDWLHGNSVQLAPDGNILYSARHQDFVYKIAYQNGAGDGHVIWKLGKGGDFTYVSDDPYPWFSHQHDVEYQDQTTISAFDNGNTRIAQFGGNSRGQALQIDEVHFTVTPFLNVDLGTFSAALGAAQRLLNGNYVFDSGLSGPPNPTQFSEWTRNGRAVSSVTSGASTYRAFRLRDLFSAP